MILNESGSGVLSLSTPLFEETPRAHLHFHNQPSKGYDMDRRHFLSLTGAAALMTSPAKLLADCQPTVSRDQCDPVGGRAFGSGTVNRSPDCTLDFRLLPETQRAITLNDGSFTWVLRLMTFDDQGQVRWTTARTIENTPVRRQSVYFGTVAAVYITCDEYTSWYSTGRITSCAAPTLRRVDWNLDYRTLDALERRQGS